LLKYFQGKIAVISLCIDNGKLLFDEHGFQNH